MSDIETIIAEELKRDENKVVYCGFTRKQLSEAFDQVKNPAHWKNPVNATVPKGSDLNLLSAAITYFAGSPSDFIENADGSINVVAPGYFECVGS